MNNVYIPSDKETIKTEYYEDGKVRRIATYLNNRLNGIAIVYSIFGVIEELIEYKDGHKHGKHRYYTPLGEVCQVCDYVDGGKHGEELIFAINGNLIRRKYYQYNSLLKTEVLFYSNGQPREVWVSKGGQKWGDTFTYDEEGKLIDVFRC